MIYKLTLGDWSQDGHNIYEEFLFECNHTISEIRQAYKDSCKRLGVTFNYNTDYTGLGLNYGDDRMIWTEYEEDTISEIAFNILKDAGCLNDIEYEECKNDYNNETRYRILDTKACAMLIMNFISLSMPDDFTYKPVEVESEPINGWWNDELNHQFGYGLFDD